MRAFASLVLLPVLLSLAAPGVCAAAAKPTEQALLKLVFPDIDSKGSAHESVVVRNFNKDYEPEQLQGDMDVNAFDSLTISNGAHSDRLLVLDVTHKDDSAHNWGGETLLALFRMTPKPKLLDVADVRADRETYFWKMLRAPRHDAVVVVATHLNASEEYQIFDLIEVKNDKFVESGVDLPMIYSSKLAEGSLAEMPTLDQIKNANPPAAIFKVKVVAKSQDPDTEAVKKQQRKTFSARLALVNGRWQCPRCSSIHPAMELIEKRFGFRSE